jgi:hypothetical protein
MDGRCSDECKFAAVPTGGYVSSGYVFAMNEDRLLLQSESNLMILAMLDARLVARHHFVTLLVYKLRIIGKFLWHT